MKRPLPFICFMGSDVQSLAISRLTAGTKQTEPPSHGLLVNSVKRLLPARSRGRTMREVPTVILLHGGPGADHSNFTALTGVAQVIYLDHRGNGRR